MKTLHRLPVCGMTFTAISILLVGATTRSFANASCTSSSNNSVNAFAQVTCSPNPALGSSGCTINVMGGLASSASGTCVAGASTSTGIITAGEGFVTEYTIMLDKSYSVLRTNSQGSSATVMDGPNGSPTFVLSVPSVSAYIWPATPGGSRALPYGSESSWENSTSGFYWEAGTVGAMTQHTINSSTLVYSSQFAMISGYVNNSAGASASMSCGVSEHTAGDGSATGSCTVGVSTLAAIR
jgi:hypothetical protein